MDILTYVLCKKYTDSTVSQSGLKGKSAYEIAVEEGFIGTEQEWLESLQGETPYIGENGNWYIGENDTGKPSSSPSLTEQELLEILQ